MSILWISEPPSIFAMLPAPEGGKVHLAVEPLPAGDAWTWVTWHSADSSAVLNGVAPTCEQAQGHAEQVAARLAAQHP